MLNKQRTLRLIKASSFMLFALLIGCQSTTQSPFSANTTAAPVQSGPAKSLNDDALWSAKNGQTDQAIELFTQLIQRYPDYPKAHLNKGLLLLNKKQYEAAQTSFQQAIKQDSNDAIAYNHLAVTQRHNGQFNQAKDHYELAIKINPEYANAHLNLAILYDIYLQQLDKALEHYLRYQSLIKQPDELLEKWIIDLKTRMKTAS